jgi:hypothetical protein
MNPDEGEANSLDDEMGVQKRRNRPPSLNKTRTTVGNQHQLQKERLVAARADLLLTC